MTKIRLLLLFLIGSGASFAQGGPQQEIGYVRILLNDLTTWEQVASIDDFIRSKQGVVMTRTDRNSDTFLAQYDLNAGITEQDFATWINSLGFDAKCTVSGLIGEPMKNFPKECYLKNTESIEQNR
ncbi:MAG TPA: hypothetical protein VK151_14265 [Fluviicola sp.]|nr:hypothetical protein [Fluviicola sp.]